MGVCIRKEKGQVERKVKEGRETEGLSDGTNNEKG